MAALMRRFETPEPTPVTVGIPVGSVHLIASDRGDTVVTVNPTDRTRAVDVEAAEKTTVDFINGAVVVQGPRPRGFKYVGWGKAGSVDVTIELPSGSPVRGDAGVGDFRADGRLGETFIRSGVGDVRLDETGAVNVVSGLGSFTINRAAGQARVVTAGEMRLGSIDADLELKNQNGKTWIGEVNGPARVKSDNGDITIDTAHSSLSVKTANGDIQIGAVETGAVDIKTAAGHVDIGISDGTSAWVDANTQFGRVLNLMGEGTAPDSAGRKVEIHARTAYGDISLHRS
jgi:DUF4097 and DUF4098 domain-containing protein YvlB